MDAASHRDPSQPWGAGGTMPAHSRAFDLFTTMDTSEANDAEERFFVPSYLRNSKYIQSLSAAHRTRQLAQREPKRPSQDDGLKAVGESVKQTLPQGSHRGMSHAVVERSMSGSEEADESLSPLPSRWNSSDIWGGIEAQQGGMNVKFTGPRTTHEREHEASAVRANNHMPHQCGIYYYEIQILSGKKDDTMIALGFASKTASLARPIGWEPESWGYHGDDGKVYTSHNVGRQFGPTFTTGDIVGCGINFRNNTAFYTKNGINLGTAFENVITKGKLYPCICLKKPGEHIRVNFGQTPFIYNIDDMMKDQRDKILREINATNTSKLQPGMSETELMQSLVMQFLQHDGYLETARAFAEDMKIQKAALSLDPDAEITSISIQDDEDANNRQRIRSAILEGNVDKALKLTTAFYPRVLRENDEVLFKLECRHFIEMVRQTAEMNMNMENSSRRRNGLTFGHEGRMQEMEVDGNNNISLETTHSGGNIADMEQGMLEYGQRLQERYANNPRKEVQVALKDIWGLLAYKNPLKEQRVSHMLDRKGRVVVSEELNSAILLSLGKSSKASVERIYAQTSVLLDQLQQTGGDGAFVSIQDVMNEIPTSTEE